MELMKTGPKRRRCTRRDVVTFGQVSLWSCKRDVYAFSPVKYPVPDVGDDAVDSVWEDRRQADIVREVEDAYAEAAWDAREAEWEANRPAWMREWEDDVFGNDWLDD